MNQLTLFNQTEAPQVERTTTDKGLYNGACVPLNSGVQPKELYEIAGRALSRGRINNADYEAAIKATDKAWEDICGK